jgi:hypothetical protein
MAVDVGLRMSKNAREETTNSWQTVMEASQAMKKGYWIVLASQAELVVGIVVAQVHPLVPHTELSIDDIFLGTALVYIPTALVGGVLVAQEKGYHFLVGYFLGLFSIPGLIVLCLIPPYLPPPTSNEERGDPDGLEGLVTESTASNRPH